MARPRKPQPKKHARGRGKGSVRRIPSGKWRAWEPLNAAGKRPSATFDTREEAEAWLDGRIADRDREAPVGGPSQPLVTFLDQWMAGKIVEVQTRPDIERSIRYVRPLWNIPLNKLTHREFQRVFAELRLESPSTGRPLSVEAVARVRKWMHAAFETAVPDLIPFNIIKRTKLPIAEKRDVPHWDEADADRFLHACLEHSPLHAFFRLSIMVGARPGELRALKWEDLNLVGEQPTILIRRNVTVAMGLQVKQTKTSRWRELQLPPECVTVLRWHRGAQSSVSEWVFCSDTGGLLPSNTVDREFKRVRKLAGVPPMIMYGCRHTFATTALDRGVPLPLVAATLGHANPAITARVYWRHLKSQKHLVVEALSSAYPLRVSGAETGQFHAELHAEGEFVHESGHA
jgi:integrase